MRSPAVLRLCDSVAAARPILAIDMTGLWNRPASGIQRVTRAITPGLFTQASDRGWDIQLVRHTRVGLELLRHWSSDTKMHQVQADLDHVSLGVHDGMSVTYAKARNLLRGRIRAFRLANRMKSGRACGEARLRRWVPRVFQEYAAAWRLRSRTQPVVADAYLTFAAGILPATLPIGVPPERSVFVLHDLIPIRFPHYYDPRMSVDFLGNLGALAMAPSVEKRRIVTASQHMAADIRHIFDGIARTTVQVDVVNWGYDSATFFPQPDVSFRKNYGIPDNAPLVVAVSTQDPRKRFADIVAAVNASSSYGIFIGAGRKRREGNAIFLGHVPDDLIRRAYSSCDVFVNWSAAEGFGLPSVEALACGARVVVPPDNPTLLEIGGRYVTVAERADIPSLCQAISRATQRVRQVPDLSRFSWQHPIKRFSELLWDEHAATGLNGAANDTYRVPHAHIHRVAA